MEGRGSTHSLRLECAFFSRDLRRGESTCSLLCSHICTEFWPRPSVTMVIVLMAVNCDRHMAQANLRWTSPENQILENPGTAVCQSFVRGPVMDIKTTMSRRLSGGPGSR
jgi:hypothetical protein